MNYQKTSIYKVSVFNFNDGKFFVDAVSIDWLKSAEGKGRKRRKFCRKSFFRRGFDCEKEQSMIFLRYDLDIKRNRIHARITANYPLSTMNHKQRQKYKTQVIHERILAKIMRAQLKFRVI